MMRDRTISQHLEEIRFRRRGKYDVTGAVKTYCTYLELKSRKIVKNRMEFMERYDIPLSGYANKYQVLDQAVYAYGRLKREIFKKDFYKEFNEADKYLPQEPELFNDEKPAESQTKGLSHMEHIAVTMTVISAKMSDIIDMLDTIIKKLEAKA